MSHRSWLHIGLRSHFLVHVDLPRPTFRLVEDIDFSNTNPRLWPQNILAQFMTLHSVSLLPGYFSNLLRLAVHVGVLERIVSQWSFTTEPTVSSPDHSGNNSRVKNQTNFDSSQDNSALERGSLALVSYSVHDLCPYAGHSCVGQINCFDAIYLDSPYRCCRKWRLRH